MVYDLLSIVLRRKASIGRKPMLKFLISLVYGESIRPL